AGSELYKSRAAPSAQHAVDGIAVNVRRAETVARRVTVGERANDVEVLLARQLRVRVGLANKIEEAGFGPFRSGDLGDDLLREDIERLLRDQDAGKRAPVAGAGRGG